MSPRAPTARHSPEPRSWILLGSGTFAGALRSRHWPGLPLLAGFGALHLLLGLDAIPLVDWDENIYAEAAKQMVRSGDYLNPVINGQPFAEKPPLFLWAQALGFHALGIGEWGARLPSAVAGLLTALLCYALGTRWQSPRLGALWGVLYLTALLPGLLGRAALIDHSFNLLIGAAAFSLYLYDEAHRAARLRAAWGWIAAASAALGIAALTKGPFGPATALFAFGAYKLVYRHPAPRWTHFAACAALSLIIAGSWYAANWAKHGGSFLERFAAFQLALFSKPLEGHSGPIYYHLVAGLIGLLPWSGFLLLIQPRGLFASNPHARPLGVLTAAWIGFVLIVMSLVSTKLPHYASPIYLPLCLWIAFALDARMGGEGESVRALGWPALAAFAVGSAVLTGLFAAVPALVRAHAAREGWRIEQDWAQGPVPADVLAATTVLALLWLAALVCFVWRRHMAGVALAALAMFVWTHGALRLHAPPYLSMVQAPLVEWTRESGERGAHIAFYRVVSFAALFYGDRPIEFLHSSKFAGDPAILDGGGAETVYTVAPLDQETRLLREHPALQPVARRGAYALFVSSPREP